MANWFRIEVDVFYDDAVDLPIDAEAQLQHSVERCIAEHDLLDVYDTGGTGIVETWKCTVDYCGKG